MSQEIFKFYGSFAVLLIIPVALNHRIYLDFSSWPIKEFSVHEDFSLIFLNLEFQLESGFIISIFSLIIW